MNHFTHFINGQWLAGQGHAIQSHDPAKKQIIWQALSASKEQVALAVQAARQAFVNRSELTFEQRLAIVKNSVNYWRPTKKNWR